jgi:hypothetical protein
MSLSGGGPLRSPRRQLVCLGRFSAPRAGHYSGMGDAQRRVTFDFAGVREVHYVAEVPEVGDFVSHFDELWVVSKIEDDDVDLLITCELPRPLPMKSGVPLA